MGSGLVRKKLARWIVACGFVKRIGTIKFPACLNKIPQVPIQAGEVEMGAGVRRFNVYGFLKMFFGFGEVPQAFVCDAEVLMNVIKIGVDL